MRCKRKMAVVSLSNSRRTCTPEVKVVGLPPVCLSTDEWRKPNRPSLRFLWRPLAHLTVNFIEKTPEDNSSNQFHVCVSSVSDGCNNIMLKIVSIHYFPVVNTCQCIDMRVNSRRLFSRDKHASKRVHCDTEHVRREVLGGRDR